MFGIVFLISSTGINAMQKNIDYVTNFDLNKYLGKWFEIARLPTSFEKDMIQVTATYSLRKNGKVNVQNEGIKNGTHKTAIGTAKIAKDVNSGYFKVSFFWPFYADYKVIELDPDYQYAMVASSYDYLWILSRTPKLPDDVLKKLLEKAKALGFDIGRLYFTPQN